LNQAATSLVHKQALSRVLKLVHNQALSRVLNQALSQVLSPELSPELSRAHNQAPSPAVTAVAMVTVLFVMNSKFHSIFSRATVAGMPVSQDADSSESSGRRKKVASALHVSDVFASVIRMHAGEMPAGVFVFRV
jgi:hypothetical protein